MINCGECGFEGLTIRSELEDGVATLHIDAHSTDMTYARVVLMKLRSLLDAAIEENVLGHSHFGISLALDPAEIRKSLRRVVG